MSHDMTIVRAQMASAMLTSFMSTNTVAVDDIDDLVERFARNADQLLGLKAAEPEVAPLVLPTGIDPDGDLVAQTVFDNGIVSLIDGKHYRMLRRHLTTHGLTPEEYFTKFGLPNDYPLTCKTYSAERSQHAKNIGLGRKGKGSAPAGNATPAPAEADKESDTGGEWNGNGNDLPEGISTVDDTIRPDHLICLEDGSEVKILSRYLKRFDLTFDAYKAKWGLPKDYPSVPAALSAKRAETARSTGLGKKAEAA